MLTETQIDIIGMVSYAVWLGLSAGLAGLLTGALILAIRTRRILTFILVGLQGVLASAGVGVGVSMVIAVLQMALCKPGLKGGWDVPLWSENIQRLAIFIAGIFGCLITPRLLPRLSCFRKVFDWALVGGLLGAIANLDNSFDGYYVLQSNVRPIHQAIGGFAAGGLVVLLWSLVVKLLREGRDQSIPSSSTTHSTPRKPASNTAPGYASSK